MPIYLRIWGVCNVSALEPIKIYRGVPTSVLMPLGNISGVSAVYTVPTGKRLILKYVRATNLDEVDVAAVYLKTGTSVTASAGDYVLYNTRIEPSETFIFEANEILEAGDKVFVWIDQLGEASVQISGIEVTL